MEQERERGITITSGRDYLLTWKQLKQPGVFKLFEDHQHAGEHYRHPRARRFHRGSGAFACVCSTAPSRCSMPWPPYSRSRRLFGARRTSTRCRASGSSTRWTGSARTSIIASRRCARSWVPTPGRSLIPIGKEDYLKGQIDVLNQKAIMYVDDGQHDGSDLPGRGNCLKT